LLFYNNFIFNVNGKSRSAFVIGTSQEASKSVPLSLLVLNRLSQQCSSDANVMEVRSDESVLITDATVRRRETARIHVKRPVLLTTTRIGLKTTLGIT